MCVSSKANVDVGDNDNFLFVWKRKTTFRATLGDYPMNFFHFHFLDKNVSSMRIHIKRNGELGN